MHVLFDSCFSQHSPVSLHNLTIIAYDQKRCYGLLLSNMNDEHKDERQRAQIGEIFSHDEINLITARHWNVIRLVTLAIWHIVVPIWQRSDKTIHEYAAYL